MTDFSPILFLDFDGVLHSASGYETAAFSRTPLLVEAISGHEVRIIVSSSWRFHHTLDELRARLPRELAGRLVGATGDPVPGEHARYQEILAWLRDSRELAPWLAIDDSAFEFPRGCPELLLCDPNVGLDRERAQQLRDWLEGLAAGS